MMNRFSFFLLSGISVCVLATAVISGSIPANDWTIAGPFGGTATTVAVDSKNPTTVLAGGMSSLLFRSNDSGGSWQLLDFPQRTLSEVTSILIDPGNSDHYLVGMIAADGAGLFDSSDRGQTWRPVNDVYGFGVRALTVAASNPSRFVAGTQRGVMLSDDSGKHWKRISDPQNLEMQGITAVAIDPNDPNVIYAGTTHLPWRTTDGGKTWDSIHTGMVDDSDVFSIYVDPQSSDENFCQCLQWNLCQQRSRRSVAQIAGNSKYLAPNPRHPLRARQLLWRSRPSRGSLCGNNDGSLPLSEQRHQLEDAD